MRKIRGKERLRRWPGYAKARWGINPAVWAMLIASERERTLSLASTAET
jgi:hypothetical protein